ncbi:hypothetical protein like AT1G05070 [Hibiscus trionum]|uniref:Uncharacterized protein n=1 Tax=Hibiscus trionum TaxID=183268 RepID=A0A9W7H5D2_HIBTR|nr:hypothetical protein like AT1G05070 [Hibiscus trionum]
MAANQAALCLLGMCLFGYIVAPPLYWHLMEGLAAIWPRSPLHFICPGTFDGTAEAKRSQALESQQRADMALLEAKKLSSQYQKEADKCNSGMEICEEAREKAEEALSAQMKLTAMWEIRARQKGWGEKVAKSHTRLQGNLQFV